MGWVRIDDSFYEHPAMISLELHAWGLWTWSLAFCNRNLTDGRVPLAAIRRMDPDGTASGALIEAGRWLQEDGEVVVKDYLDYQPSAEQIRSKRDKERERWQRRASSPAAAIPSAPTPRGVAPPSASTPPASQPQPQPDTYVSESGAHSAPAPTTTKRPRGTRIPDPFIVTDDMVTWAETELPRFDWTRETVRFKDHWLAAAGAKGVKQDWPATWRNWMRRAAEGTYR